MHHKLFALMIYHLVQLHGEHALHASQRMIPPQIRLRQKRYHAFFLFLFLFLFLLLFLSCRIMLPWWFFSLWKDAT